MLLPNGDLDLLSLERRELGRNVLPFLGTGDEALDGRDNGILVRADLLGRVTISERDGAVLDGLEVNGDAQGRAELVVTAVTLADRGRGRVHAGRDANLAQLLRDLVDEGLELLVGRQGHNEDLGWGDRRGEREDLVVQSVMCSCYMLVCLEETYSAGLVAAVLGGAVPVDVLDQRVLADLDRAVADAGDLELELAVVGELLGELLALLLSGGLEGGLDRLAVLLELGAKLLLVNLNLPLLEDAGLVETLAHDERGARLLGVDGQVVGAAVGAADTLDPAGGGEELGVPAVGGVVGHLVLHVLAEADLGHVDTNLLQEEVDAGEEVAEGLVVDDLVAHGVANRHLLDIRLAGELGVAVQQGELDGFNLGEAVVLLAALGVDKETGARGDLVAVGATDRGRGEGHLLHVEVEELGEVEELALGGLGAQVASQVAAGANGGLEHEVEGDGRRGLDAGSRVLEFVLLDELAELRAVVVVDLGQDLLVLLDDGIVELDGLGLCLSLLLLLGVVLLLDLFTAGLLVALEAGLEHVLDEVIGTQDIAVLGVLAHPVGELVDVARGLEDLVRGQDGGVDLEHVLLEDEVLAPEVDDVGLQGAAGGAVVEEAGNAAVDLEGRSEEQAPAQHGVERLPVEGLTLQGRRGGRHLGDGGVGLVLFRGDEDLSPGEVAGGGEGAVLEVVVGVGVGAGGQGGGGVTAVAVEKSGRPNCTEASCGTN
ncbi:hypothetical protein ColTof3_01215 [Colletotrichum tofieldiae]|nr:hypothetical protein ColTof3_01215 [Colletotrichum tofieldiae]